MSQKASEPTRPASSSSRAASAKSTQILEINFKDFLKKVFDDEENIVRNSKNKWPLLIDETERCQRFLMHRDVNMVNCLDAEAFKPNKFRLAVIAAIRYGKPVVIDFMGLKNEPDFMNHLRETCNQIDKDFYDQLFNKTLIEKENYLKLVRPEDGEDFQKYYFKDELIERFMVIFTTSNPAPSKDLLSTTLPIKVL